MSARAEHVVAVDTEHLATADTERKAAASLVATAAMAGFELRRLADGQWLISRWNLQRGLVDADAVREFLSAAGVRA